MTAIYTTHDARENLAELLQRVANGEVITIRRYKKTVALVQPVSNDIAKAVNAGIMRLNTYPTHLARQCFRRIVDRVSAGETIAIRRYKALIAMIASTALPTGFSPGYIYVLRCGEHYKIGRSTNVNQRIAVLQNASPHKIELVVSIPNDFTVLTEATLHKDLHEYHVRGEWYRLPDNPRSLPAINALISLGQNFPV